MVQKTLNKWLFCKEMIRCTGMVFIARQESFVCEHCGKNVDPLKQGSYRNHCPYCLWSKCVDRDGPGDRASQCQALMEPVGLDQDSKRGWMIIHQCTGCKKTIRNKAAPDDDITRFQEKISKNWQAKESKK